MRLLSILLFIAPVWAQTARPLPEMSDETVIATFDDGARLTMGDFKRIYAVLPPENQQQAMQNREAFVQQWALMRKLTRMAETDKLDQLSPSKEALEYYRMVILSQAKMNQALQEITVLPSDVSEYYETYKFKYQQVHVKAIYLSFGASKVTEESAKAKALKILAEARAGADFAKLAKENSDDETSRDKNGDFAMLRPSDNIPDAVRTAIFALKQGEISEPVRQPNGYYLFRLQEVSYRPLSEVRTDIFSELKQKRYREWLDKANSSSTVLFGNTGFLGAIPLDTTPKK